jgi:hypothetical protein
MSKAKLKATAIFVLLPLFLLFSISLGYVLFTQTFTSTVTEPIVVTVTKELAPSIYPGQFTTLEFNVKNNGPVTYGIIITETHTFPEGVYISQVVVDGFTYTFGSKFTIGPGETYPVTVTVVAPKSAGSGLISLNIMVERTSP